MISTKSVALIISAALLLMGCNSVKPLTDDQAKDLIEQSKDWQQHQATPVYPTDAELNDGTQKSLWATQTILVGKPELHLSVPATCFTGYNHYEGYFSSGPEFRKKIVGITSIHDPISVHGSSFGDKVKVAQFTFSFDFAGCPDAVRDVFKNHVQSGKAIFLFHDDGWRLEDIKYTTD